MKNLAVVLLTLSLSASAQITSVLQKPVETEEVSCEYAPGSARSPEVTSPQRVSASVEVNAKLLPAKMKKDERCYTTWTLVLRVRNSPAQVLVFDEDDDENSLQYKAEIDSWSPDGRVLLFSKVPYGGDWDGTQPFIYDISSGRVSRVALDKAFKHLHRADCYLYFRPVAFMTSEEFAVESGTFEHDLAPGQKPCFPDRAWAVNFRTLAVRRIDSKQLPPRVGVVRENAK